MSSEKLAVRDKKKILGQVFTPEWVVSLILKKIDYYGEAILGKYVFEPGCGNGNFLVEIVKEYIEAAQAKNYTNKRIKQDIERYIYGVEKDPEAYRACITRLDGLVEKNDLRNIKWNIHNADILDLNLAQLPEFDYVVGNPPYVRIHNLEKERLSEIKSRFDFCKNGIIDLFLVFFEIGIKTLNQKTGRLGFITPNSFIHNSTYVDFRRYLVSHKLIRSLINFKENSIFDEASTYNAITVLDMVHANDSFDYYEYMSGDVVPISKIDLTEQDLKKWNFTNKEDAIFLEGIKQGGKRISDSAVAQYGFATLLDRAYVIKGGTLFSLPDEEQAIAYPVVKASRYDGKKIVDRIIYPYYKSKGVWAPIPEEELRKKYPKTYAHLLGNKEDLKRRSCDKQVRFWYEYGRSQGIQTIHKEKLVINPIFKDEIKVFKVNEKTMVYSGIYLFIKEGSEYALEDFLKILKSDVFLRYARLVGKDMRGGYKNINTRAIKDFPIDLCL